MIFQPSVGLHLWHPSLCFSKEILSSWGPVVNPFKPVEHRSRESVSGDVADGQAGADPSAAVTSHWDASGRWPLPSSYSIVMYRLSIYLYIYIYV